MTRPIGGSAAEEYKGYEIGHIHYGNERTTDAVVCPVLIDYHNVLGTHSRGNKQLRQTPIGVKTTR